MSSPAQESAFADSATSVPVQASTSKTESRLSVGEYHALQYEKRVENKAEAPKPIIDGSSEWNTNGSIPTDYGSDISDAPWRTGKSRPQQPTPSRPQSRTIRSQGRVDPVKTIRALQERALWMPSGSEIASRFGAI
ncbi:hypothetical protein PC117_g7997 [Phytophthora cactorum]|uniref:Uncharacterized protein n=1 Tax=Phytophthora cactorum TaxID=29920 RepID=A0A8T1E374_9STRA|nr:hypothetical protein PC117_g7997 [Phytophthora cactorum]